MSSGQLGWGQSRQTVGLDLTAKDLTQGVAFCRKHEYCARTVFARVTVNRGLVQPDRYRSRFIVPLYQRLQLSLSSGFSDAAIYPSIVQEFVNVRSSERYREVVQRCQGLRFHHPGKRPGPVRALPCHPGHRLQVAAGRPEGDLRRRAGPEGHAG
ncbi:hypothetical protein XFF6990_110032 [Xanthomonas citri pv. fuscans]|uniref:Uncharacterized protein n=1 Tax=Xanthomonas campestris pv. phaseoli TaxID=317013 RepID=A0A7Z7NHC4_XANCH|nr:hypothetical protein XFF6990_110032 [Xanthomonas citri pv. fuscans]SOO24016.1 hypothetical protein XFF6991_320015 [Xanthomonas phaseoli pv. phaseoli]